MTRRTGYHGLPAEHHTPAGEHEGWDAALGYLQALEKSGRPIVVAISDPRQEQLGRPYATEQIGFLRMLPDREDQPQVHRFAVNWPDPDQPCGVLTVDGRRFEGARLSTGDGDHYFGLKLALGAIGVWVLDSNSNMDSAVGEWTKRYRQTYLDLPTPDEIEQKWKAEPNRARIRSIKQDLEEVRHELVKRGATVAEGMSETELAAAAERVSWNLRTSGRMSKVDPTEWRTLWLEEFADNLREGAG
jgi:hypothetical protein